jgi:hypothetical protein
MNTNEKYRVESKKKLKTFQEAKFVCLCYAIMFFAEDLCLHSKASNCCVCSTGFANLMYICSVQFVNLVNL